MTVLQSLIKQMIALDATSRPSFEALLSKARGNAFPECFYSSLHDFISNVNDTSASSPFASASNTVAPGGTPSFAPSVQIRPNFADEKALYTEANMSDTHALPSDSDRRLGRVWAGFAEIETYQASDLQEPASMNFKIDYAATYTSAKPIQVYIRSLNSLLSGFSRLRVVRVSFQLY